jgi:hypothetical protein
MPHKPRNLIRFSLLPILLLASACDQNEPVWQPTPAEDRKVLTVILEHFSARKDIMSVSDDGVVLIRPEVGTGVDVNLPANDGSTIPCEAPSDALKMSSDRSQIYQSAAEVVSDTPKWKLATPAELEQAAPIPPFGVERTLPRAKTVVAVTIPGYSDKGRVATAVINFSWSIHGARAQYLLKRTGNDWKVTCSKLTFYV